MPDLHTRLLADVIALGARYPLVLTGGYAVRARVNRPSQDLDVATENPAPEAAALKCVYMALMSMDPTGKGRKRWTMRWKAPLNAFQIAFEGRLTPTNH
ncbi:hypothetical protein [Streptomyces sp. NBC_01483]|uniref:hypothetical protein n=1 Tax=Streptomyces sp. NBC_01483 TaxID=2903883 RepID=UPI003FCE492A